MSRSAALASGEHCYVASARAGSASQYPESPVIAAVAARCSGDIRWIPGADGPTGSLGYRLAARYLTPSRPLLARQTDFHSLFHSSRRL